MNEKQKAAGRSVGRAIRWPIVLVGMTLITSVSLMPYAKAQSDDADMILKAMSDYVASQKTLSITFDSDIEVVTANLQKIQFTSSGHVQLSRPDKLRATRTGGYSDVELVFDGKMLTVNNKDANGFVQFEAPGSVDQLIDRRCHGRQRCCDRFRDRAGARTLLWHHGAVHRRRAQQHAEFFDRSRRRQRSASRHRQDGHDARGGQLYLQRRRLWIFRSER